MKTIIKYICILVIGGIIGWIVGWLIVGILGITSTVALNTIRVAWVLGIFIGFLFGRNWNKWKNFWSKR